MISLYPWHYWQSKSVHNEFQYLPGPSLSAPLVLLARRRSAWPSSRPGPAGPPASRGTSARRPARTPPSTQTRRRRRLRAARCEDPPPQQRGRQRRRRRSRARRSRTLSWAMGWRGTSPWRGRGTSPAAPSSPRTRSSTRTRTTRPPAAPCSRAWRPSHTQTPADLSKSQQTWSHRAESWRNLGPIWGWPGHASPWRSCWFGTPCWYLFEYFLYNWFRSLFPIIFLLGSTYFYFTWIMEYCLKTCIMHYNTILLSQTC